MPSWLEKDNLEAALLRQEDMDPETVFGRFQRPNVQVMLGPRPR